MPHLTLLRYSGQSVVEHAYQPSDGEDRQAGGEREVRPHNLAADGSMASHAEWQKGNYARQSTLAAEGSMRT